MKQLKLRAAKSAQFWRLLLAQPATGEAKFYAQQKQYQKNIHTRTLEG